MSQVFNVNYSHTGLFRRTIQRPSPLLLFPPPPFPPGSQDVHEKAPHVKSLMIAGPRGVGKKTLVHAICTETGAIMFDLTPGNIAAKYPGKAGLNMLLHMVFKVQYSSTCVSYICIILHV